MYKQGDFTIRKTADGYMLSWEKSLTPKNKVMQSAWCPEPNKIGKHLKKWIKDMEKK